MQSRRGMLSLLVKWRSEEIQTIMMTWAGNITIMPDKFHQTQIWIASFLCLIFSLLYYLAPRDKAEFLAGAAMAFVGFLTGKFSNGFTKKQP